MDFARSKVVGLLKYTEAVPELTALLSAADPLGFRVGGGLIHVVLVIALIVIAVNLLRGRRALG